MLKKINILPATDKTDICLL